MAKRAWLGVAGLVASCWSPAVFGQGNTFNPYGNSGYADYREFTTPMYSNDPSLPGQARLQSESYGGKRGANQFEAYTSSLDGSNADQLNSNRGVRTGIPYYQAYRLFDKKDSRVYKPNSKSDQDFLEQLNKRDEDYQKALQEKDPNKRAVLIQRIERSALAQPARTPAKAATAKAKAAKAPAARVVDPPAARRPAAAATAPKPRAVAPAATDPAPAAVPAVNPSAVPIPAPG